MQTGKLLAVALFAIGALGSSPGHAQPAQSRNVLQAMDVAAAGDQVTVRLSFTEPLAHIPTGFSLTSPARVALDFPNTESALAQQDVANTTRGILRNVRLAQSESRMRLVLNLEKAATYQSKLEGNDLLVTLTVAGVDQSSRRADTSFKSEKSLKKQYSVKDIAFRRGSGGEGKVVIDLENPSVGIDVRKQGNLISVEIADSTVADSLLRKLDVTDFNTPISGVLITRTNNTVKLEITPRSSDLWEHIAYQTDNQFVVEVRQIQEDNNLLGGGIGRYVGERMSLRFREYPIREVLQAFSDFSNLNIVISDSVTGTITLNLQDVPWDQALDVILQQKNYQMDKRGSVVTIAPKEEILARRRASSELVTFDPTRDVVIPLGYILAIDAKKLIEEYLKDDARTESKVSVQGSRPGLLEGGAFQGERRTGSDVTLRVTADPQTNKIFIRASEATIQAIRALLKEIDVPHRQVLIEARIVEAQEGFSRNLGARLGFSTKSGVSSTPQYQIAGGSNLNIPVSTATPGALQFWLANAATTRTLSLELMAAESDGKSKLISSPRVLTANGKKATIADGEQVPYQTSENNTIKTTFADATLALNISPNINADGRIAMKITVTKNSVGKDTPAGPTILTKNVVTEVVVENGGTVVIGGIYKEDNREGVNKVPFLGDLPLIGWMFRQQTKSSERAETLVFITPRIVGEDLAFR